MTALGRLVLTVIAMVIFGAVTWWAYELAGGGADRPPCSVCDR